MSSRFEELDRRQTPIGEISLRRRVEPTLQLEVYEVKLGDEFLMSSLFTVAEVALADLALADLPGRDLDVVVGGLGLGYTARAVLQDSRVRSMHVVEALDAVIGWHERELVPFATELTSDPRCRLINGDFFLMVADGSAFGSDPSDRYDAALVDIDHSPRHLLHPNHAAFYTPSGLRRLTHRLRLGGVFALWSDGAPDSDFIAAVEEVFASCEAHVVTFPNFYTGSDSASTVYVAGPPPCDCPSDRNLVVGCGRQQPREESAMGTETARPPWHPPPWFVHVAWRAHRALYKFSRGRFLWTPSNKRGWGAMRLTTVGRKSGQERSVIIGYLEDGPNLVAIAMNGWDEGHPSWWLNLEVHPDAVVSLADHDARPVRALRVAGEERDRLWRRWTSVEPKLDGYAGRRSTETPVIVFEPRDDTA